MKSSRIAPGPHQASGIQPAFSASIQMSSLLFFMFVVFTFIVTELGTDPGSA